MGKLRNVLLLTVISLSSLGISLKSVSNDINKANAEACTYVETSFTSEKILITADITVNDVTKSFYLSSTTGGSSAAPSAVEFIDVNSIDDSQLWNVELVDESTNSYRIYNDSNKYLYINYNSDTSLRLSNEEHEWNYDVDNNSLSSTIQDSKSNEITRYLTGNQYNNNYTWRTLTSPNTYSEFKFYKIEEHVDINDVNLYYSLSFRYDIDKEGNMTSDFYLLLGADSSLLMSYLPSKSGGIKVTSTGSLNKTVHYELDGSKETNSIVYKALHLGDILNNLERINDTFLINAYYIDEDDNKVYSSISRTESIYSLVESYYLNQDTREVVNELYEIFVNYNNSNN